MHHPPAFRLFSALIGVLFVFNFAQPLGMGDMSMSGMNMGGMNHPSAAAPTGASTLAAHCADIAVSGEERAQSHSHAGQQSSTSAPGDESTHSQSSSGQQSSAPADGEKECKLHECCASALVHVSLTPVTTLSWLPEHVISQETPHSGNCVVETDGQLLLPFANGPPRTVIA